MYGNWVSPRCSSPSQISWTARSTELRDFPKAISRERSAEITKDCVKAIDNCVNLTACTWTRDGSLKDATLEALSRHPYLHTLEINGHHNWFVNLWHMVSISLPSRRNYDPELLTNFSHLRKLSIIMPSTETVQVIPACIQRNRATLEAFTVICKASPPLSGFFSSADQLIRQFTNQVNDGWLKDTAKLLAGVKQFHVAGCPKVTHQGILDVLSENTAGITSLALEGVSTHFVSLLIPICIVS